MLTDIFARRYQDVPIWKEFSETERRLLVQGFGIVKDALAPFGSDGNVHAGNKPHWEMVHNQLAREIGMKQLADRGYHYEYTMAGQKATGWHAYRWDQTCEHFVTALPGGKVDPDQFIKERLSFVELGLRARETGVQLENAGFERELREAERMDKLVRLGTDGRYSELGRAVMSSRLSAAEGALQGLRGSLVQRLHVVQQSRENPKTAPVTLTTMHGSKGLEFDAVFIIRAADHIIPGRAETPEDVEEERRLLYVGMTRARDSLTVTSARKYGLSRWARPAYLTMLLNVNGSPFEESGDDYAWLNKV